MVVTAAVGRASAKATTRHSAQSGSGSRFFVEGIMAVDSAVLWSQITRLYIVTTCSLNGAACGGGGDRPGGLVLAFFCAQCSPFARARVAVASKAGCVQLGVYKALTCAASRPRARVRGCTRHGRGG